MLKRKTLEAMGIETDKIDSIMDGHGETVDALQTKIKELESKLAEAETKLKTVDTSEDWKTKYAAVQAELDKFKNDVAERDEKRAKADAYRNVLKEAGISEKRIDSIMKVSNGIIGEMKLDKDGNIKDKEALLENAKTEWADFIPVTVKVNNKAPKPPENSGKTLTKDDILKIADTQERQKAIAEHLDLFQKG